MNIYFQTFTQNKSKDAVELLRFFSAFGQSSQTHGTARISAGGRVAMFKFTHSQELVEKAAKKRFNELEVRLTLVSFDIGMSRNSEATVTGVFKPSASSDLWFSSSDWPAGGDRSTRNRKMNAKAAELSLEYYKVKQKPCSFEVVFEIATKKSVSEILDAIAQTLIRNTPQTLRQIQPFGCCDIGGNDFCVRLESDFLTTSHVRVMANIMPPVYPRLGAYFDSLHPLLFGTKDLCRGLASAIGSHAKLITDQGALAALWINPDCDMPVATKRASRWLLRE